jgi:hypothetical protein
MISVLGLHPTLLTRTRPRPPRPPEHPQRRPQDRRSLLGSRGRSSRKPLGGLDGGCHGL